MTDTIHIGDTFPKVGFIVKDKDGNRLDLSPTGLDLSTASIEIQFIDPEEDTLHLTRTAVNVDLKDVPTNAGDPHFRHLWLTGDFTTETGSIQLWAVMTFVSGDVLRTSKKTMRVIQHALNS